MKTNHSILISKLRHFPEVSEGQLVDALIADLLELHDRESISLDNWDSAKKLIKLRTGLDIVPNGV